MNAFEEPFWNLDQLLAWALWRDRELVNFASGGRTWHEIGDRAFATALRKKIANCGPPLGSIGHHIGER